MFHSVGLNSYHYAVHIIKTPLMILIRGETDCKVLIFLFLYEFILYAYIMLCFDT